ncbi:KpsF/GutQ family protein [Anopheles sinensis]|uniref:KpsF/GutQ family protein n=1 Tax=Anopheles sinensis TaxID=74873 RepID=A0A084VSS9_ANOSI|nr:KpsF/GutQ family protein [Anopheles sinensis]
MKDRTGPVSGGFGLVLAVGKILKKPTTRWIPPLRMRKQHSRLRRLEPRSVEVCSTEKMLNTSGISRVAHCPLFAQFAAGKYTLGKQLSQTTTGRVCTVALSPGGPSQGFARAVCAFEATWAQALTSLLWHTVPSKPLSSWHKCAPQVFFTPNSFSPEQLLPAGDQWDPYVIEYGENGLSRRWRLTLSHQQWMWMFFNPGGGRTERNDQVAAKRVGFGGHLKFTHSSAQMHAQFLPAPLGRR